MEANERWRIAVVALSVLLCGPLWASDEDRFQTEFTRNLTWRGGDIVIDHKFGSVQITAQGGSSVAVRATIRSSDRPLGEQIRVVATEERNGVVIRTEYPPRRARRGQESFSVDYRITVPAKARLSVKNEFGAINVSGSRSGAEIRNTHGGIRVRDTDGLLRIENRFGSIEVFNSDGDVVIQNTNASVVASNIGGAVDIENRFASVKVTDARKTVTIRNSNGSVAVTDVDGDASIANSFGSLKATGVAGDLQVTGQSGRIDVRDVGGSTTIRSSRGSITAADIRRDVTIRTSFGSAFVRGAGGAIDVVNQSGAIAVSELTGRTCQPITLRGNHSSIKVSLPPRASYAVDARTVAGRIRSSVNINTSAASEEMVIGTIGKGGCSMELVNSHGAITIAVDD